MKKFLKWYLPIHFMCAFLNMGMLTYAQIEVMYRHGAYSLRELHEFQQETRTLKYTLSFVVGPLASVALLTFVAENKFPHPALGIAWDENIIWPDYHSETLKLDLRNRPPG